MLEFRTQDKEMKKEAKINNNLNNAKSKMITIDYQKHGIYGPNKKNLIASRYATWKFIHITCEELNS